MHVHFISKQPAMSLEGSRWGVQQPWLTSGLFRDTFGKELVPLLALELSPPWDSPICPLDVLLCQAAVTAWTHQGKEPVPRPWVLGE